MNSLFPSRRDLMNLNRGFLGNTFDNLFIDDADFDVDIEETDSAYIVKADLPGLTKEEIKLDYTDNILSISAYQETEKEEKDKDKKFIRRERSSRSYQRQFLIKNVDESDIKASFENGVLTVDLPKKDPEDSKERRIEIE